MGLDHSQVRRYRPWLRHTILAIAAHAIHAVTAAKRREHHPDPILPTHGDDDPPDDYGLIARTVPEVHRLFMLHAEIQRLPIAIARRSAGLRPRCARDGRPGDADTKPEPAGSITGRDC